MFVYLSIYLLSIIFLCCLRRGVVADHPGPVPEHQHHGHPLSVLHGTQRPGSQHQVSGAIYFWMFPTAKAGVTLRARH